MKKNRWFNKRVQVLIHITVWCFIYLLPYLFYDAHNTTPKVFTKQDERNFLLLNSAQNIIWIALFYINGLLLVPKYITPKKYLKYTGWLLVCLVMVISFNHLLYRSIFVQHHFNPANAIRFNLPTFILTLAVSTLWKLSQIHFDNEKLALEKRDESLKTELSFLRSQISPHFVFNVLNNIVALVRLKSEELEPTVMKLSGLMQYMLYETNEELVPVKTEAEYLQSYIDLQQQRFGKKVKINTAIEVNNQWSMIEPMLLIPFVENAFKHGVGMIEQPQIDIDLKTTDDNKLAFSVRNKYNNERDHVKDKTSGIGLANVERRLKLLYNGRHTLSIDKQQNWFNALLTIQLHHD